AASDVPGATMAAIQRIERTSAIRFMIVPPCVDDGKTSTPRQTIRYAAPRCGRQGVARGAVTRAPTRQGRRGQLAEAQGRRAPGWFGGPPPRVRPGGRQA